MIRETVSALLACLVSFVLCAVAYPAVVWGLAQLAFPDQAQGSLIYDDRDRTVIGSELIAQPFASDRYFQPRPSAVDYKADATGGSNLGTKNPDLHKKIVERVEALKATPERPVRPPGRRPVQPPRVQVSTPTSVRKPRSTRLVVLPPLVRFPKLKSASCWPGRSITRARSSARLLASTS